MQNPRFWAGWNSLKRQNLFIVGCLIRNAGLESIPSAPPFFSITYSQRHRWLFWPGEQDLNQLSRV
jgi:hypothetical protein